MFLGSTFTFILAMYLIWQIWSQNCWTEYSAKCNTCSAWHSGCMWTEDVYWPRYDVTSPSKWHSLLRGPNESTSPLWTVLPDSWNLFLHSSQPKENMAIVQLSSFKSYQVYEWTRYQVLACFTHGLAGFYTLYTGTSFTRLFSCIS